MADKPYSCDEADKVLEACARAAHEANRAYNVAIGERGVYLPSEPPSENPPLKQGRRFFARWDNGPGKRNVGDFFEIVFGTAGNFEEITNP